MGVSSAVRVPITSPHRPSQPRPHQPAHNQWNRLVSSLNRFFTHMTNPTATAPTLTTTKTTTKTTKSPTNAPSSSSPSSSSKHGNTSAGHTYTKLPSSLPGTRKTNPRAVTVEDGDEVGDEVDLEAQRPVLVREWWGR